MPLRPSETAQCEVCEEYCRLHELVGVKYRADDDQVILTQGESSERPRSASESARIAASGFVCGTFAEESPGWRGFWI